MTDTPAGTFGRYRETPAADMPAETRAAYDLTKRLRGLVPGPHKIWLANPALLTAIVPTGEYYQRRSTLSKAEIEIVTLLTVTHWRAAYGTAEHERIAEAGGGLPPETVERLIAGLPVAFDDQRQQLVYELAYALTAGRTIAAGLFRRAQDAIGNAGLVDVTVLIGWFTAVAATLNAYDVPTGATGLDQ